VDENVASPADRGYDAETFASYARRIRKPPSEVLELPRVNLMSVYEYVGNPHAHTSYSTDGAGLHAEVAKAAEEAGLNFVIVTDHNVWVDGCEQYYGSVLVLVGEEVHDVRRQPQGNHLLAYNAGTELTPFASDPQRLIDEAIRHGGTSYLAHPYDYSSPLGRHLHAAPWYDWDVRGFTGMEIWNYMSEFKGLLRGGLSTSIYTRHPAWGIIGPYRSTLRRWDELLALGLRVSAIGGADAYGYPSAPGPDGRTVLPYRYLFGCVNTHILTKRPLSGVFERDKAMVHEALRYGHTWVGYDLIAPTEGFRFKARSGPNEGTIGDDLRRTGALVIEVHTPRRADIRLVRNGKVVKRRRGDHLRYTTAQPGVYRVEAYRRYKMLSRGWIFSSPIYVT
jgi:hypothetical protein